VRAQAFRLGAVDVIDKPTAAVSPDLRQTRGALIQQTLRRVLGLPAVNVPREPLPADGALATASILAVHVQGFAALCERVEASALVKLLNEELALVDAVTKMHGGLIDAQVSGSTLAAFGVPKRRVDHAEAAVAAATELLDGLADLRSERREAGSPFLDVGAMVVTGLVLAGEFGPLGARRYRTMGGVLDQAARLGRANEDYGAELIVCARTLATLGTSAPHRRLDVVQLEAESEPIELYELVLPRSDLDAVTLEAYARAMKHYETGHFGSAIQGFDEVLRRRPADRAAARLLMRSRSLQAAPTSSWRGVWAVDAAGGER
jgi:class 3 adenylate cyclase